MVEPAFGIGGALTALQQNRPAPAANAEAGDLRNAAGELSRAARGMEMATGNISGQTSAISQMAMAQQQQMNLLQANITQLNSSISQLASSMNRMATNMSMGGMGMPGPAPGPAGVGAMSYGGGGMPGADMGGGGAFGMARRAFFGASGAIARGAGALVSPWMGQQYAPPAPGQYAGMVGNAGGMRSAFMGMGMIPPRLLRQSYGGEITQLGADRAAQRFGDIGIGMGMGGVRMAGAGIGAWGGRAIGAGLGAAAGSILGPLGTMAGGAIGGYFGGQVGAAAGGGAATGLTRPIINQMGAIRGGGELMGRQAFRFMDPSQLHGGASMPTFRARQEMGQMMTQQGISDLTFSEQDMQEMGGAMVENDLLRGVNNMRELRRRFTSTKESLKEMGRAMGQTHQEAAGTLGELQALGIGPGGAMGAIGGLGVRGLTRREAMAGQAAFVGQYAGTGLQGAGLMGLGASSQALAQTSIAQGALSPAQLAAVGGRAGAQQLMGGMTTSALQGSIGQVMMMSGMGGGGGPTGINQMMNRAGANATAGNLVAFAADPQKMMRDAMKDPDGASARTFLAMSDMAKQLSPDDASYEDTLKMVVAQQLGKSPQEATAYVEMMKNFPKMQREKNRERLRTLNQQTESISMENVDPFARAGRAAKNMIMRGPLGMGVNAATKQVANVQDKVSNIISDVKDRILDTTTVGIRTKDINLKNVRSALKTATERTSKERSDVANAKPSDSQKSQARGDVISRMGNDASIQMELDDLREERDPILRKAKAQEIMNKVTGGEYENMSPEMKSAYESAINETGINISTALSEVSLQDFGPEEMEKLKEDQDKVRDLLGDGEGFLGFGGKPLSREQLAGMTSNPKTEKMLDLIASGNIKGAQQMIGDAEGGEQKMLSDFFNRAKKAQEQGNLGDLRSRFKSLREKAEPLAVQKARAGAGAAIRKSLEGAGLDVAGGTAEASLGGLVSTIRGLSEKDIGQMEGEGARVAREFQAIESAKTMEELEAAVGEKRAKELLHGEEFDLSNNPRQAYELAATNMLQSFGLEGPVTAESGDPGSIIAGKGQTMDQRRMQSDMLQTMSRNATVLEKLDSTLNKLIDKKKLGQRGIIP